MASATSACLRGRRLVVLFIEFPLLVVRWCLDWDSTVFGVVGWGSSPVRARIGHLLTQTPNVPRGSRRLVRWQTGCEGRISYLKGVYG
jgi:hypothetical protein